MDQPPNEVATHPATGESVVQRSCWTNIVRAELFRRTQRRGERELASGPTCTTVWTSWLSAQRDGNGPASVASGCRGTFECGRAGELESRRNPASFSRALLPGPDSPTFSWLSPCLYKTAWTMVQPGSPPSPPTTWACPRTPRTTASLRSNSSETQVRCKISRAKAQLELN